MRHPALIALLAAALVGLGFAAARVLAVGAPTQAPLVYAGTVTDAAGKPYPTAVEVTVAFYDAAVGGARKCKAAPVMAEAGSGRFSVILPADCAAAVHDKTDLWSEAVVGSTQTVLPRVHVGAVPYALEADQAKVAAGAVGGLKATVDALQAEVAALKQAGGGGGGGGPWVVDAKGVKLGRFLGFGEAALPPMASQVQLIASGRYQLLTTTGHIVDIQVDGQFWSGVPGYAFTAGGCTGNAIQYVPEGTVFPNRRVLTMPNKKQYVVSGAVSGVTSPAENVWQSTFEYGVKCVNNLQKMSSSIVLQETTPAAIGLPASIAGPLNIVQ